VNDAKASTLQGNGHTAACGRSRHPASRGISTSMCVVQRGNHRQVTFYGADDYLFYLACLKEAAEKHQCDVHAYVLMTNHVHLLVTQHDKQGIGKMMQSIGIMVRLDF